MSITSVLTDTVTVKRFTPSVVDKAIPGQTLTVNNQPNQSAFLEVKSEGITITPLAFVTVAGIGIGELDYYVLQDRAVSTRWKLAIENGLVTLDSTTDEPMLDLIMQDTTNENVYWEVYTENGLLVTGVTTAVAGATQTTGGVLEHIPISENGMALSTNSFIAITGITTVGLVGGSISLRAVDEVGQPVNNEILVAQNELVRFYFKRGIVQIQGVGKDNEGKFKMMAQGTLEILPKDLVYSSNVTHGVTLSEVEFVRTLFDFAGATHHKEITFNSIS